MPTPTSLGRVGVKALALFTVTSTAAVLMGILMGLVIQPGLGTPTEGLMNADVPEAATVSIVRLLLSIVPENPFNALAQGEVLPIIFFAILLGAAIIVSGEEGQPLRGFLESANAAVVRITGWVLELAPFGTFALMAWVVGIDLAIAKFPHKNDETNAVLWEATALALAHKADIPVPQWWVETVAGRPVLLVKRFDRHGGERIPFLSAMSLLGANEGDKPSPGIMSFPMAGTTLALDFANDGAQTLSLLTRLDAITRAAGGRVYPAKDGRVSAPDFQAGYPMWRDFARHTDPGFSSSFWRRVARENGA